MQSLSPYAVIVCHFSTLSLIPKDAYQFSDHSAAWADPDWGQGVRTPLKNHKNIGYLSNFGPDPLKKITKLPSQHSIFGHHRPASETLFKWRSLGADHGPLIVVFGSYLTSSIYKNMLSKLDPLCQNFLDPRMSIFLKSVHQIC